MAIRSIRTRRTTLMGNERLEELLKTIAQSKIAITAQTAILKQAESDLFDEMVKRKMLVFTAEGELAEIVTPQGRSSTWIDARKFFKLVDEKTFFSVVTVPVGEAKKVLTERQLATISTKAEGKSGEPTLVVKSLGKGK